MCNKAPDLLLQRLEHGSGLADVVLRHSCLIVHSKLPTDANCLQLDRFCSAFHKAPFWGHCCTFCTLPNSNMWSHSMACVYTSMLVHQSLAGQTPAYIADDIQLVTDSDRRQLRSAAARTCLVPRTHNNFGDRSFGAAGPACGTVYCSTCDETRNLRVSSVN